MATERERLLNIQNCAGMRVRRAARTISEFYNEVMASSGLHANQFVMLVPPYLKPEMTVSELAQIMALDRTTLARNLKVLEDRGLLTLLPGEDQRTRVIHLTEQGQQAMMEALPLWERAQQQVIAQLGAEQVSQLFSFLDELEALPDTVTSD